MLTRFFISTALILVFVPALGCTTETSVDASLDPASGATVESAKRAPAKAGTYEVPMPAEQQAAATFPVDKVKWSVNARGATLDYDLPLGLTGTKQRVVLKGPYDAAKGAYVLAGNAGTGECQVVGANVRCLEQLPGIAVDEAAALQNVEAAVDVNARKNVIDVFRFDPVGVLRFEASTRGRDD